MTPGKAVTASGLDAGVMVWAQPVADMTLEHGPLCALDRQQAVYWQRRCRVAEDQLAKAHTRIAYFRQQCWRTYLALAGDQGEPPETPPEGALDPEVDVAALRAARDVRAAYDRLQRG